MKKDTQGEQKGMLDYVAMDKALKAHRRDTKVVRYVRGIRPIFGTEEYEN